MISKEPKENLTVDKMELRQKREEFAMEIRKQKTETMLNAKRIKLVNDHKQQNDLNQGAPIEMNKAAKYVKMKEFGQLLKEAVTLKDPEKMFYPLEKLREVISIDEEIPLEEFVSLGLKPVIQSIVEDYIKNTNLVKECLWILVNVTCKSNDRIKPVVDTSLVKALLQCLLHTDISVLESALWVLANIASDSEEFNLMLCEQGIAAIIDQLTKLRKEFSDEALNNLSWLISNLMRYRNFVKLAPLVPILPSLLKTENPHVISSTLSAYSYITLTPDGIKLAMETHKLLSVDVVKLLEFNSSSVQAMAMRNIGNLLTLSPCPYLPIMEEHGLYSKLATLLKNKKPTIRREASWVVSNILAEGPNILDRIMSTRIIPTLIELTDKDIPDVIAEVMFALYNAISASSLRQVQILEDMGIIKSICAGFAQDDAHLLLNTLICYEALLQKGEIVKDEENLPVNPYVLALEKQNVIKTFERLQNHKNNDVYKKTIEIIDKYFKEFIN